MNRDPKGNSSIPPPKPSPSSPQPFKSLADSAKKNASQLGDPVSLKAETSNTNPTEKDLGASSGGSGRDYSGETTSGGMKTESQGGESLKNKLQRKIQENPTALGDPVSLKSEKKDDTGSDGEVVRRKTSKF